MPPKNTLRTTVSRSIVVPRLSVQQLQPRKMLETSESRPTHATKIQSQRSKLFSVTWARWRDYLQSLPLVSFFLIIDSSIKPWPYISKNCSQNKLHYDYAPMHPKGAYWGGVASQTTAPGAFSIAGAARVGRGISHWIIRLAVVCV